MKQSTKEKTSLTKMTGMSLTLFLGLYIIVSPDKPQNLTNTILFGISAWVFTLPLFTIMLKYYLILRKGYRYHHRWWKKTLIYIVVLGIITATLIYGNTHLFLFRL